MRATSPSMFLELIIVIIYIKEYNFWSSPSCSPLQPPIISFLLDPNIPHNVEDQFRYPYETRCKNIRLYIVVFRPSDCPSSVCSCFPVNPRFCARAQTGSPGWRAASQAPNQHTKQRSVYGTRRTVVPWVSHAVYRENVWSQESGSEWHVSCTIRRIYY